jgi:hypothetical protein
MSFSSEQLAFLCRGREYLPNSFLGTCFAFREPTHFLTAAHCVGNLEAGNLSIFTPAAFLLPESVLPVKSIVRHPKADLALLTVPPVDEGLILPFRDVASPAALGDEFCAFGFPEETNVVGLPHGDTLGF